MMFLWFGEIDAELELPYDTISAKVTHVI